MLALLAVLVTVGCQPRTPNPTAGVDQSSPAPESTIPLGALRLTVLDRLDAPQPEPVAPISGPDIKLRAFFAALKSLETGQSKQPVVVLQLGDSHTAGDRLSGGLRARLQQRFGDAGRGFLPPAVPYGGYRPTEIKVSAMSGWTIFNSFSSKAPGPFGITGFRARATGPGQSMSVTALAPGGADRAVIELLMQPGGGGMSVTIDGQAYGTLASAAPNLKVGWADLTLPAGSHSLSLTTRGDGPVDLLGWGLARAAPGIVYASEGISGATIGVLDHWNRRLAAWEINGLAPALIVVAFGTNEGFAAQVDAQAYRTLFERQIDFLRASAPGASILIIGPPDGQRLSTGCHAVSYCAGTGLSHRRCAWRTPVGLAQIRAIQRAVADDRHLAFWDWSSVMGDDCGTNRWALVQPPLARPDHIHFTWAGYDLAAQALFDRLMQDYANFGQAGWKSTMVSP